MNIKCIFGVIHQLNQQIGNKNQTTVYKVVFSPSNRSTYVVIKKKKRLFENPLKLTYNLGYSYIDIQ